MLNKFNIFKFFCDLELLDPDPEACGSKSGSRVSTLLRIHADPDPKHCPKHCLKNLFISLVEEKRKKILNFFHFSVIIELLDPDPESASLMQIRIQGVNFNADPCTSESESLLLTMVKLCLSYFYMMKDNFLKKASHDTMNRYRVP